VGLISVERDITKRKEAERQIREREELLRAFMESATDVYTIWNSRLELLDVSEKGTKAFLPTAKREDLIGKHITEIVPDVKKTGRYSDYLNVMKTGQPFQADDVIIHPKFGNKYISIKAFKVGDGMGLVITDVTKRKRAEEELLRLSNAVRMSTDSIVISDLEVKIVEVNEATLRMYGTDNKGDLVGKNSYDLIAPEDREKAIASAKEVLERGYTKNREYHIITKDGSTILVAMNTAIMKDVDGKPTGFVAVSRDITERKESEKALRESEEFSSSLLNNAPNPVLVINPDTSVRYVNPALEKLTGFSSAELINRKIPYPWWTEETLEKTSKELKEAMSKGAERLEIMFQKKNGERFWVEITSRPIRRHGELDHYLSNWVDITERKKAEEELQHHSERLRVMAMQLSDAQERERQRLSQELHDRVGQNLTALGINLSMVRTQLPEEAVAPVRSILDDSQSVLEQTAEIIRDVMADLRPPVLEDYGLVAALRWYADRFASRTGISVTVQGKGLIPRLNTSSENTLFRIVQETLTNVAKHAQATKVTVIVVVKKRAVRLVITDDGVGFNVADVINSNVQQGWGLTTMSERVKSLGGSFDIESRPGHGTRVIVEIGR
jgi:PAS domain S-box-containing protein